MKPLTLLASPDLFSQVPIHRSQASDAGNSHRPGGKKQTDADRDGTVSKMLEARTKYDIANARNLLGKERQLHEDLANTVSKIIELSEANADPFVIIPELIRAIEIQSVVTEDYDEFRENLTFLKRELISKIPLEQKQKYLEAVESAITQEPAIRIFSRAELDDLKFDYSQVQEPFTNMGYVAEEFEEYCDKSSLQEPKVQRKLFKTN